MKRFYFCLAGLCLLLCLFCRCSAGGLDEAGKSIGEGEFSGGMSEFEMIKDSDGPEESEENDADPETEPEEPEPASFLSAVMNTETDVGFEFSGPVKIVSLFFEPALNISSIEDGSFVKVYLEEAAGPGMLIKAIILAEDERENVISAEVSFRSRNKRPPKLLINELRTEYSRPNVEYIEFKIMSSGNLGALRVFASGYFRSPMIYQFSPVEVMEGEYVVLHMRTLDGSCVDEYGERLDESGGAGSCPTARDFWVPGSAKLLHKTTAVYVLDQDDNVLDAVMTSELQDSWWNRDYFAEAAAFLFNKGAWKSAAGEICGPRDAVNSAKINTAMTRSISRDESAEDTNTSADWYVTATGGATPGLANSPVRFQ